MPKRIILNGEARDEKSLSPEAKKAQQARQIHKIAKPLLQLITPMSDLTMDPMNARLHPDRNIQSIKDSLTRYGQLKPLVVRADNRIIVAGNGTYEAALQLGWTHIAASIVDLSEIEALGFGLADNRTAELAKWDYEVVTHIESLLTESGEPVIGWEEDELFLFRSAEFIPPVVEDDSVWEKPKEEDEGLAITGFSKEQMDLVNRAADRIRRLVGDTGLTLPDCLTKIIMEWSRNQAATRIDTRK